MARRKEVGCQVDLGNGGSDNPDKREPAFSDMKYGVEEYPPWHVSLIAGLQLVMSTVGGALIVIYTVRNLICAGHHNLLFAELMATSIFMVGVCTFLQTTFGVRIPCIQGSSFTFLIPTIAMMKTEQWKCPPACSQVFNETLISLPEGTYIDGVACDNEAWRPRLLEISGGLAIASTVHILIGLSGIMGFLQNYIGPLTVAPSIGLVGLSLFHVATKAAQHHWGIAAITLVSYVIFTLFLAPCHVPFPLWTRGKGCGFPRFPLFQMFPILLSILIGWLASFIFTVTGLLSDDPNDLSYHARTDARADVMHTSEWIFIPRPGYWGMPSASAAITVGMVAVVWQSILESMGDYYAMAAVCNLPTPPKHAVNRGVAMEGLGSLLSGIMGACHATTTYSQVVGVVAITKISSRFTCQIAAVMFMACGIFGKFGAVLSMCPDPVIGALNILGLGMVSATGISALRHCNMTSLRNMIILSLSLMLGLMMPFYMADNPHVINTGNLVLDQVVYVFLSTGMLIGAFVGFVLDNLVPGTREERGLAAYLKDLNVAPDDISDDCPDAPRTSRFHPVYDLPYVSGWLRRHKIFSYFPFLPSYTERAFLQKFYRKLRRRKPAESTSLDSKARTTKTSNDDNNNTLSAETFLLANTVDIEKFKENVTDL